MSTVFYDCTKCGVEIGSAQEITWQNHKPFHPECAAPISEEDDFDTPGTALDEGGEEKV